LKDISANGKPGVPVTPILIYWGRRITSPEGRVRTLGSVWAVKGAEAKEWIELLRSVRINEGDRLTAIKAVQELEG
jgi:hypothetical protein